MGSNVAAEGEVALRCDADEMRGGKELGVHPCVLT